VVLRPPSYDKGLDALDVGLKYQLIASIFLKLCDITKYSGGLEMSINYLKLYQGNYCENGPVIDVCDRVI